MRALVSGGAGHLGSHLCRLLLEQGYDVVCADNLSTGRIANIEPMRADSAFRFLEWDVTQPMTVEENLDEIYHLASPASPPEYMRMPLETLAVNSIGTENLLRLALQNGAGFLFASTSEVYGDPLLHPQPESYWGNVNPNGVRSCYDEAKRFGEALTMAYVRTRGADARIVRIFNTYGPNSRPADGRMVPNFICQALTGRPLTIYGTGRQSRSLCYVTDTAEGIRRTMTAGIEPGEVINLGSPEEHTVEEYARMIAQLCDLPYTPLFRPAAEDDPMRRRPDITKARTLLGWEPVWKVTDGLQMTVDWFRGQDIACGASPHEPEATSLAVNPPPR